MSSTNIVSDPKKVFINGKNVIVYEHLVIKKDVYKSINTCLANPFDATAYNEMDNMLRPLWNHLIKNDEEASSGRQPCCPFYDFLEYAGQKR